MSFAITSYKTGAVYSKYNMKILDTHIMYDLVIASL